MIKDAALLTAALALRSLGQAGLLIVLARLGSPEILGNYSLALAITAPIFVLCEFGLRTVYLTHKGEQPFSSYLQVRLCTLALGVFAATAAGALFIPQLVVLLLAVSFLRVADSVGELYSGPLQRHGRLKPILAGFAVNAALTVTVGAAVLVIFQDLLAVIGALIVVSGLTTIFLFKRPVDKVLAPKGTRSWRKFWLWNANHTAVVRAGLPTGISWGLLSLLSSIPQYFLVAYFSQVEVGYFAILLYVVVVVEIFLNAVSQSWIPAAKDLYRRSKSFVLAVLKTSFIWTVAFVPLSCFICVVAHFMLPMVFGPTYQVAWAEGVPLFFALVMLPMVFFSAMALNVANSYVKALCTSLASASVATLAAFLLIPGQGVPGALWVCAIALASRALFAFSALAIRSGAPHTALLRH